MTSQDIPWGSDAPISLPVALETTDTAMVDMEGFCFTPDGLRVNVSHAEREEIVARGYSPRRGRG